MILGFVRNGLIRVGAAAAVAGLMAVVGCGVPVDTSQNNVRTFSGGNVATNSSAPSTNPAWSSNSATSDPSPTGASDTTTRFEPTRISFADAEHGLVAGNLWSGDSSKGTVLQTSDGGRHWRTVYTGGTGIAGISAIAAESYITVATQEASEITYATLVSSNGGAFRHLTDEALVDEHFLSAENGWALSPSTDSIQNHLLKTLDGGKTWTQVKTPSSPDTSVICDFIFLDASHGWLLTAGQPGAGQEPKATYVTSDGGTTWTKTAWTSMLGGGAHGGLGGGGYANGIAFNSPTHGFLWEQRGGVLQTLNGGRLWTGTSIGAPEAFEASSMTFTGQSLGFALFRDNDQRKYILKQTTDGGKSWTTTYEWPMD